MPLVQMDMVLMTQVLVNLLDNAHKYSPPESVIEVIAQVETELADRWRSPTGARGCRNTI